METLEEPAEMVGNYRFTIRAGEQTPESEERWNGRVEALAKLLLELWRIEQQRRVAERN